VHFGNFCSQLSELDVAIWSYAEGYVGHVNGRTCRVQHVKATDGGKLITCGHRGENQGRNMDARRDKITTFIF
jgi:hypothetical protein